MSPNPPRVPGRAVAHGLTAVLTIAASGCMGFSSVRPAVVPDGFAMDARLSTTTGLGPTASTFWGIGEVIGCLDNRVAAFDVGMRYGLRPMGGPIGVEAGLGVASPMQVYGEAFVGAGQDGPLAFGVGGRAPLLAASTHPAPYRVDGRLDWRVAPRARLLFNAGWFRYDDRGDHHLNAIVPAVGLHIGGEGLYVTPSIAWIRGWGVGWNSCPGAGSDDPFRMSAFEASIGFTVLLGDPLRP